LQTTRLIKDTDELEKIRQACLITDKVMTILPELIHTDITEGELAAEINFCMQKFGAAHPAFDTISSFGPHSAEPHYTHGETRLGENDFIVCDFGATYQKYHADLTRTFINGTPTTEQKKMHRVVHHAQQVGFDTIRPGIVANKVHQAVAKAINATSFKGKFIHSTGHSLGLLVHDGPGFTSDNSLILKENMVFTVEPGVYQSGIGGVRIEDNIRVTKNGIELLSNSSRELIEITC
jgi:Xaa-Pro dipeptidase